MSLSKNILDREYDKFYEKNGNTVIGVTQPQVYSTPFNESSVSSRSVVFDLKANTPSISKLRNNVVSTGTATVAIDEGEYKVDVPSGSTLLLESAERGRYTPGYVSQAGIGFRFPNVNLIGESYAEWGYFTDDSGIGFGKDSKGVYVFIMNGTKTKIYQENWNIDTLTGSGPSGASLDTSDGNIYQVDYVWYGYGSIVFSVQLKGDESFNQPVHRYMPDSGVSVKQPNLNISAFVKNDAQSTFSTYVGGRQYSIYGDVNRISRSTGEFTNGKSVSTSWTPLITFRKKNALAEQLAQTAKILDASVASSSDLIFSYFYDATLTGASFGNPSGHDANETILEADTSATALTGGFAVGRKNVIIGAQGNAVNKTEDEGFRFNLIENKNITLAARTISGTATVDVASFNMIEEW